MRHAQKLGDTTWIVFIPLFFSFFSSVKLKSGESIPINASGGLLRILFIILLLIKKILGKCLRTPNIPITESSEELNQFKHPALTICGPATPSNVASGNCSFIESIILEANKSPDDSPATITNLDTITGFYRIQRTIPLEEAFRKLIITCNSFETSLRPEIFS